MARSTIPGTRGKRIPGNPRMPKASMAGFHMTRIPHAQPYTQSSDLFAQFHRRQVRDAQGQFAGGWGVGWQGLADVAENIEQYGIQVQGNVQEAAEKLAEEMLQWAKQNAPWEDEDPPHVAPGAREALQSGVVWESDTRFVIWLGHGKDIFYGIWLEVRFGGKFAIILPTIMHFAPQIGDRIRTAT